MPTWARTTRFKPLPLPVFPDGDPTPDDRELALALFGELDAASQAWYGGPAFIERMREQAS